MIPLGEKCCSLSFLPATPSLNADHSVSLRDVGRVAPLASPIRFGFLRHTTPTRYTRATRLTPCPQSFLLCDFYISMENGNEFSMISLFVPLSMCFKNFLLFFVARNEARVLCSLLSNGV